jgi:hypothetical protein
MTKENFRDWRWNQHMGRSVDEALAEIEREAHIRLKCFDKWVGEGRLSWVDAFDRLERLLSAVKHLRDMQTANKLDELRNTALGVNTDHSEVEAWAAEAKNVIAKTVMFNQTPPTTAQESSEGSELRQNMA